MAKVHKPHIVCIPYPSQSHIGAMTKLAKLLHLKGFCITFVNTEHNHKRLLKARGPQSLDGLQDFQFRAVSDGLPPLDDDTIPDRKAIAQSVQMNGLAPFLSLLDNLNEETGRPPVSCIVSDGIVSFTFAAAQQLGIPLVLFWTISACAFMGFYQFPALVEKGLTPLKDESHLSNGHLDTIIDWIPGMNGIRFRDLPTYVRTTDPNDSSFNLCVELMGRCTKVSANILHTFNALEKNVLDSLSQMLPFLYTVGPLELLLSQVTEQSEEEDAKSIGLNLWKEESECLEWLDSKEPRSVIYVSFGSLASLTIKQLIEIGWGLSNSNYNFLLIVRPDLVSGDSAFLASEFMAEAKKRGLIRSWCSQEKVLNHQSVGGFLTHGGWSSTIESLSAGVPMICLPFVGDQLMNCRYIWSEWSVGLEMDKDDFDREKVEKLVREVMGGDEGVKLRQKAEEWKKLAEEATSGPNGSSSLALDNLVNKLKVLSSVREMNP